MTVIFALPGFLKGRGEEEIQCFHIRGNGPTPAPRKNSRSAAQEVFRPGKSRLPDNGGACRQSAYAKGESFPFSSRTATAPPADFSGIDMTGGQHLAYKGARFESGQRFLKLEVHFLGRHGINDVKSFFSAVSELTQHCTGASIIRGNGTIFSAQRILDAAEMS